MDMFTSYGHIKNLMILAWASPFKIIYLNAVLHIYTFTVTAKVVLSTPVHLTLVDAIVTEDQFSLFIQLFLSKQSFQAEREVRRRTGGGEWRA